MTTRNLTLGVPGALYHRIRERAEQNNRSVEDETLDLLASAIPASDALPRELAEEVSSLALLDKDSLWRAARGHLAAEAASALEALHAV